MKAVEVLGIVMLIACLCVSVADAKKMYLVNIDKGEMTTDGRQGTLTEEHASTKGGLALKVTAKKGEGIYFGEWGAKRGNWSDFEYLRFNVFNPTTEIVNLTMNIGDDVSQKDWGYNTRAQPTFVCRPGMSEQELQIQGITANDGRALNLKSIRVWNIAFKAPADKDLTLYFSNIRLETEDEGKEEKKEEKKKK